MADSTAVPSAVMVTPPDSNLIQQPDPNPNPINPQFSIPSPIQQPFRPYQQAPPPGVMMPPQQPYPMPGQPIRYAAPPMPPNGYQMPPQVGMPPGVLRYPSPYGPMLRPPYPPRPLGVVMPPIVRPPILVRGPILPTVRPPVLANVAVPDKPQTTVYVGKISSTVENDFMLSLLQLCGPVKNWKRPQDPAGNLKGFGFCEFESAEGVLRALRLLNKLSVDGQELMLNVNQTTRQYLERFVELKSESSKVSRTEGTNKEETSTNTNETALKSSEESLKPSLDGQKKDGNETPNKENAYTTNLGLVTDEDRETDREAVEKLTGMLEERLKSHPLPPPPPPPPRLVDGFLKSNSEQQSESRDKDSDAEDKIEDEKTAESKLLERNESGSPDRSKRQDRPKERETKREKERELERYEREREQDRAKREKDREYKSREEERRYKVREKDWEVREREREHWRKKEREREKERAHERKWEVIDQEQDSEDGHGKKRKHKANDEERKRRLKEKEEDLADKVREEEEIAEAKLRAEEEKEKTLQEAMSIISSQTAKEHPKADLQYDMFEDQDNDVDQLPNQNMAADQTASHGTSEGQVALHNGIKDEPITSPSAAADTKQNTSAQSRKLGFGLSLTGKRASVPSVFKEEDEEAHKDKKMRPLVPIDYSTEEQQTVQPSSPEGPPANVAAASEFLKRISSKEEKTDIEKEKGRRSHERSGHRDRSRHAEDHNSNREESRKDGYDRERSNKSKTTEKQKLLDAKQLIDTIPKTKDELFAYEIKWLIYDQNALHEKMRPWISKKITEYLGEEELTLVDYIVSSTQEHVDANEMLERLQSILDEEAEMFVLKMWRMLIFEIKRVENGLATKSRA